MSYLKIKIPLSILLSVGGCAASANVDIERTLVWRNAGTCPIIFSIYRDNEKNIVTELDDEMLTLCKKALQKMFLNIQDRREKRS